ncbi:AMP-dependent synthetase/ligase [Nakamurella sp.]|uniref:AMP-dependent synthetase/ligase n=1 Tax=Nakamurella sp. TaxID=1869182 RepID=UPI0037840DA0
MTAALTDRAQSFGHLFVDRIEQTPNREAFRYLDGGAWRSMSWAQTKVRVFNIAAGLVGLGVQPQQRVAIAATTRIEWILADLGVLCAGAATTTVYPTTAREDVAYILGDSDSVVLIAENANQANKALDSDLPDLKAIVLFDGTEADVHRHEGVEVVTLAELEQRGAALLAEQPTVIDDRIAGCGPEDLATLVYTSGTTGKPKGVRLVHDNWTYEGKAVAALNILGPDDVQYLWLPMSHVLGKILSAVQLEFGFSTAVDGDLTRIVENLGTIKPTFMGGAPRIFEKVRAKVTLTAQGEGGLKAKIYDWAIGVGIKASRLRQQGKQPGFLLRLQLKIADKLVLSKVRERMGGRIRFFISGSAALSQEVYEWFDAVGMTILEGYGLTETSAAFSVNLPGDSRIATVGPPLPGSQVKIAEDGEIMLKGPGVMRGYHNRPDATDEVFTDGWFHSGDIGELVDGYIKITDRKKDLIKTSGGKYVAPQKIEVIFSAECPYSGHIVVHGDGRHFASALITLDDEMIQEWAAKNGLGGKSTAELANDPQVYALIDEYVQKLNSQLERWETIKKFIILPRDLTIEDGELTPSMKVRRKIVEQKYLSELDSLYK